MENKLTSNKGFNQYRPIINRNTKTAVTHTEITKYGRAMATVQYRIFLTSNCQFRLQAGPSGSKMNFLTCGTNNVLYN
jgi:hypothetical protein